MTPDEAGVVVSLAEIYAKVCAVETGVTKIEAKVDAALAHTADHESRLRVLERKVWLAAGAASGVTGVIVAAVTQLLQGTGKA